MLDIDPEEWAEAPDPGHDPWADEPPDYAPETDSGYWAAIEDEWDLPPPSSYKVEAVPEPTLAAEGDGRERTTWWPVDLAGLFDGSVDLPEPQVFTRTDGQPLLYPGKNHAFNGESESGKSWAALLACVQVIGAGGHVLYLDFEDTAPTVVTRLLALGAKPDNAIRYFHYAAPSEPLQTKGGQFTKGYMDFVDLLGASELTLAVIDGVTEAMALHGLSTNDNDEYARFHAMLPRLIARAGPATVQIDHVTKNKEDRGRYAIGAQHKLAGMDGAVFVFEVAKPMGLGLHGIARMNITKDRPGQLRRHAVGPKHTVGEFHLQSDPTTHALLAKVERPDAKATAEAERVEHWRLMEEISRYVEAHGPVNKNRIVAEVEGVDGARSTPAKRDAIEDLLQGNFLRLERQGQAYLHHHVKPYRYFPSNATKDHETP